MVKELDNPMTQAAFGDLVGIGQPAVSDLMRRGIIQPGMNARAWLQAYCEHLRAVGDERDPDGELTAGRTRVARATAEKVEMLNAQTRREYAPVVLLGAVLRDIAGQISGHLGDLVPNIRCCLPELQSSVLAQIEAEVTACREVCSAANLADADRLDSEEFDDDAPGVE